MNLPERVCDVPPYLYAEMDKVIGEAKRSGKKIINIAHGDPDLPPPQEVVDELNHAAREGGSHLYPSYWGMGELREKIGQFMKKRFDVNLDPEGEIMVLIGAKEGITHLFMALCEKGDYGLIPNPSYPTYKTSVIFSEGVPIDLPLTAENDFLPDISGLKPEILNKARMMIINYPNNPTSKAADLGFFKDLIQFCQKWGIYLVHDDAYSEIYEKSPPPSILQVEGAKDIAVEIHSFSKTFSMQGYRIGWICGSRELIRALSIIKTNTDSGVFVPIQKAAIKALSVYEDFVPRLRDIYKERRALVNRLLRDFGWQSYPSDTTIYVWTRMACKEQDSMRFVINLIKEYGVMIGPGAGYGKYGEGYLRFALTQPVNKIKEGLSKFIAFVRKNGE
ncbi:MAG TPA: aminotransferase class I/II-fold pyridoxal phosphate-dependent enzyme [bacterium (Candidatus Stahlbacteria)]|nr:aminotransferase class I/II-fold pyridoxal phosphate-dependent enzyme [Candidatus Stahlbacteria bacterium]